jgi:hypothetical protein
VAIYLPAFIQRAYDGPLLPVFGRRRVITSHEVNLAVTRKYWVASVRLVIARLFIAKF